MTVGAPIIASGKVEWRYRTVTILAGDWVGTQHVTVQKTVVGLPTENYLILPAGQGQGRKGITFNSNLYAARLRYVDTSTVEFLLFVAGGSFDVQLSWYELILPNQVAHEQQVVGDVFNTGFVNDTFKTTEVTTLGAFKEGDMVVGSDISAGFLYDNDNTFRGRRADYSPIKAAGNTFDIEVDVADGSDSDTYTFWYQVVQA